MIWAPPPPPHPPPVSKLFLLYVYMGHQSSLLTGEKVKGGGGGAKSYESEKAWSDVYHSILSGAVSWVRTKPGVRRSFLL
jgi:hypothetical protein